MGLSSFQARASQANDGQLHQPLVLYLVSQLALVSLLSLNLKLVRAECVRCPWLLAQTKVATILGTFFHFLFFFLSSCYHRYSKPQKGLSQGFKILHGHLKTNNKNLGKTIFFTQIFIIFFQGPMQKFETIRQPLLWF